MNDDDHIHLAAFVKRAGQWGLQLFGDELENNNGNVKEALKNARLRFNGQPFPPPSPMTEMMRLVDQIGTAKEMGIVLPEEALIGIKQEEPKAQLEQKKFGNKPKTGKVRPSPFER